MRIRARAALAAALVIAAGGIAWLSGSSPFRSLRQRRESLMNGHRPFVLRLAGERQWRPCSADSARAGSIRCAGNGLDPASADEALSLTREARGSAEPAQGEAGWALAVVDFLSGSLDAAGAANRMETLEALVAADSANASLRNDLAVAYFARGDAWSAFLGLEQIERAHAADRGSDLIAFNRAAALDALHLSHEARAAWSEYLRDHRESGWAGEAERQLAGAAARLDATPDEQRDDPQHQRELALDSLLPRWAEALSAGRLAAADSACSLMRQMEARAPGAARACATRDREVAAAALRYADGSARFRRGAFVEAGPILGDAARRFRSLHMASLADWADVTRGFVDIYASRWARADSTFAAIERAAAARGEGALEARALWGRALSTGRQGRNPVEYLTRAADLYDRLGERLNRGSMTYLIADYLFQLGRDEVAWRDLRESFALIDDRLDTRARSGPYITAGQALIDVGLPVAAVAVLREAVGETGNSTRPNERPETLLRLASAEVAAGREGDARAHIREALDGFAAIRDPLMLERHQMEAALTLARLDAARAPDSAIARLTQAEAYYRRANLQFNRAVPLARRGQLLLRRGDTVRARQDIEAATTAIERQEASTGDAIASRDRAAARREVFDALVALAVARADTVGAFIAAERARGNITTRGPVIEPGRVVLSYYALPDRLLLWILRGDRLRLAAIPVTTARLRDAVARVAAMVRRGDDDAEWRALSRAAYARFVAPAARELSDAATMTIVPDGTLGWLPFAALMDSSGRYLAERVVLGYGLATRSSSVAMPSLAAPVVVGEPSPDPRAFPGLGVLRGAMREVGAVRQAYPQAIALVDSAATRQAVARAMGRATLFHFAGHAQLVERMPSQSHLVLASGGGGGDVAGSVLSAEEISRMDLRHMGLAILSSCGTSQARTRGNGAPTGLSEAFFAAGARGVISSRWVVEDEGTAELMERLHAALARGAPPAEALAMAQRSLMRQSSAAHPLAAWGAFVYEQP